MKIIQMDINDIKPYKNNPRINNSKAIDKVAESIKEFGFRQPLVVDKDNNIIAGHTRLKAAKKLKVKTLPVVIADDMTDQQIKAYRIADNKTNEYSEWDFELLAQELEEIEMFTGFDDEEIDNILNNIELIEPNTQQNNKGHLHDSSKMAIFNLHTYRIKYTEDEEIIDRFREVALKLCETENEELKNKADKIIFVKMLEALEEIEKL
jgi:hypothetical protein